MKKQQFSSIIVGIGCLLILLISACGDDIDDDNNSADNDGYNASDHAFADPINGETRIGKPFVNTVLKNKLRSFKMLSELPLRIVYQYITRITRGDSCIRMQTFCSYITSSGGNLSSGMRNCNRVVQVLL